MTTQHSPAPAKSRKSWVVFLILLFLGVMGYRACKPSAPPPAKGERTVPVLTTSVKAGELPIKLSALGTVIPTDVVTVKTRVDGYIKSIAFKEGQFVKQGQLLVQIDPRPFQVDLNKALAQLAKDKAILENAKNDLKRMQAMIEFKIVPQQTLDTQVSTVKQLEATIQSDEAVMQSARLNLTYSQVTSPISGKVGLRLVDVGNVARASDTSGLAVVTPISPITVVFTLPSDQIQKVLGRENLTVEAYDREGAKLICTGKMQAIDNQIDTATGTVKVRAIFDNRHGELYPNQFVNIYLLVDTLKNALLVPSAAIQKSPKGTFVYVNKGGEAEMRPVEVFSTQGELTALKSGLSAGEEIITEGLEKLKPGSKIKVSEPDSKGKKSKGKEGAGKDKDKAGAHEKPGPDKAERKPGKQ